MRQEKYMSTEVTAHRLKMLMRERNWGVKAFANRIPADKNSVKTIQMAVLTVLQHFQ